ncbi:hypothetical protein [Bradyrhizobium shewense]|uniref:hypothetical protein n=1 Tax=Bradyrhizobium shewense TaxID=1761772 RepID=UPI0013F62068|nr:hypothetical protein [Bradyrhizobium shewense]
MHLYVMVGIAVIVAVLILAAPLILTLLGDGLHWKILAVVATAAIAIVMLWIPAGFVAYAAAVGCANRAQEKRKRRLQIEARGLAAVRRALHVPWSARLLRRLRLRS